MPRKTIALIAGLVGVTIVLFVVALTTNKAGATYQHKWYPSISPSVIPTETVPSVEPSLEVTPSLGPIPTATPSSPVGGDGRSDGQSDGRSDGLCSQPPCVSGNAVPQNAPATGRG